MQIAILGLGVTGQSLLKLLLWAHQKRRTSFYLTESFYHHPLKLYAVHEGDELKVDPKLGPYVEILDFEHFSRSAKNFDLVLTSPGIDPRRKELRGVELVSEVAFSLSFIKDIPVIAVTGTNGKSTCVTMIDQLLKKAGKKTFLGGNLGTPLASLVANEEGEVDYLVLELSSFQLEATPDLKAIVGVFLNFSRSHMERYDHMDDYFKAKLNIFNGHRPKQCLSLVSSQLKKTSQYNSLLAPKLRDLNHQWFTHFADQLDKPNNFPVAYFSELYEILKAINNFLNLQVSDERIQNILMDFQGLEARMESMEKNGHTYINNSKATNLESVMTSILSFKHVLNDLTLIIGGKLRESEENERENLRIFLQNPLVQKVSKICFFGEVSKLYLGRDQSIKECLAESDKSQYILFSPGYPSFDEFTNYIERGRHFKFLINDM